MALMITTTKSQLQPRLLLLVAQSPANTEATHTCSVLIRPKQCAVILPQKGEQGTKSSVTSNGITSQHIKHGLTQSNHSQITASTAHTGAKLMWLLLCRNESCDLSANKTSTHPPHVTNGYPPNRFMPQPWTYNPTPQPKLHNAVDVCRVSLCSAHDITNPEVTAATSSTQAGVTQVPTNRHGDQLFCRQP